MLIGITSDFETITDRRGCPASRFVSPHPYVAALTSVGADPVILPHLDPSKASKLLDKLAGLVISGGDFDVPPSFYGKEARPKLGNLLPERSEFERALCLEALRRDLPLLAICGGMQLMNVVLGGTLYQDLSERPNTDVHEQPHDRSKPQHSVDIETESLLRRACGKKQLDVNSTHHQVVRQLGKGIISSAVAPDGVIEAIEIPGRRFAVGIQWHPELLAKPEQLAIYASFVESTEAATVGNPEN